MNLKTQIIGTWILIEHSEIDENLVGSLVYSADNKMSVHITGKINGEEILIKYSGSYSLHPGFITHKVDISDNPKRIGTEQKRFVQLTGNLMTLTDETNFKAVWVKQ